MRQEDIGVNKKMLKESHPTRYFVEQMRSEQMPLRLPVIDIRGDTLHCDMVKLKLQGLSLRVMREFILRHGRLPHVALLRLIESSLPAGRPADIWALNIITKLRSLCEANFASTHPQLCWLPSKGRSDTWLLVRLKERYVLAHMHERGRVANLFHRHKFHYAPTS